MAIKLSQFTSSKIWSVIFNQSTIFSVDKSEPICITLPCEAENRFCKYVSGCGGGSYKRSKRWREKRWTRFGSRGWIWASLICLWSLISPERELWSYSQSAQFVLRTENGAWEWQCFKAIQKDTAETPPNVSYHVTPSAKKADTCTQICISNGAYGIFQVASTIFLNLEAKRGK